jgi:hypothetical protein
MKDDFPFTLIALLGFVTIVAITAIIMAGGGSFDLPSATLAGQATTLPSGEVVYEQHVWFASEYPQAYTGAMDGAGHMDVASPIWYIARSDGTIYTRSTVYDAATFESTLRAGGAKFIPTFDSGSDLAFLDTAAGRNAQADRVVALAVNNNYPGVDIDYEFLPSTRREAFSDYVTILASKLHANGKTLSVTVHPKWNDNTTGGGRGAQNWTHIGQHADQVRIMLYGWSDDIPTTVDPLSPLYWIDGILKYAETTIPAQKIVVGLPWYGYDYVIVSGAVVNHTKVDWTTVQQHIAVYNPTITRDPAGTRTSGEIAYSYTQNGVTHAVFYPDAQAYAIKTADVKAKHPNIGGFVTFMGGFEEPATWDVVNGLRGSGTPPPPPPATPAITLTSPAAGQTWTVGEQRAITFSATNAESITIQLVGTTTSTLATLPGTATTYSWTITQPAGSYTLKTTAQNANGAATDQEALTLRWSCSDSDAGSIYVQGTTTSNGPIASATDACGTSTECKTLGTRVTSCVKEYSCATDGSIKSALTKCSCANGACPKKGK